jgi:hypothetical protein
MDVAHGNQSDLTCEANVRLTGMVETIGGFQRQRRFQIKAFLDLEDALCEENRSVRPF